MGIPIQGFLYLQYFEQFCLSRGSNRPGTAVGHTGLRPGRPSILLVAFVEFPRRFHGALFRGSDQDVGVSATGIACLWLAPAFLPAACPGGDGIAMARISYAGRHFHEKPPTCIIRISFDSFLGGIPVPAVSWPAFFPLAVRFIVGDGISAAPMYW